MDELKDIYRKALPAHIAQLETARAALPGDTAAAGTLRRIAHSLRGSGGTYGFPDISRAAAAVEEARSVELGGRADQLIQLLRTIAASPALTVDIALAPSTASHPHILVVDDDAEIRLMARFLLQAAGYTVHEAADAATAAGLLFAHPIELLLMDVMLGDADGITVAEQLLRDLPAPETKLIFLTGASRADHIARMNSSGAAGIITKPFDPTTFVATVERLAGVSA